MALNTVSSDRLSTNVKTSNLGTELSKKVGQNKNLIINGIGDLYNDTILILSKGKIYKYLL